MKIDTVTLEAGKILTVVSDYLSSGVVSDSCNDLDHPPVFIAPGQVKNFGIYTTSKSFQIVSNTGQLVTYESVRTDYVYTDTGVYGTLSVIPDGNDAILIDNAQSLVYGSLTVNGSYIVNGELRVLDWPT